ncbi:hypothetical protein [Anaeromyxobacter sp. PSR-1]|uniref:hypothetical protein n=1 Tax=Anaeromyxobacter sp. PSR-1 TaxID=1300915 RepID=UPI0005DE9DA8|nr:hypothetical protein [Anaeromyxobacter sp. PSR-1]GAO01229.1 hypothetical protein PSR1_00081 [Anaeromyxobacter sp. PSR-1]
MPVGREVQFLNIDLLLVGRFHRKPLLAALGDEVFVLHEDAQFEGEECLILEVLEPELDLANTLMRLLKWARGLPPAARRAWAAASRRVFDIGIAAGLRPHESHWEIRAEEVAALAALNAEVVLTVYGADGNGPPSPTSSPSQRSGRGLAEKRGSGRGTRMRPKGKR